MTDIELLELAARAALIDFADQPFMHHRAPAMLLKDGTVWNPLSNDGDALRLAVKLRINIESDTATVLCRLQPSYIKREKTVFVESYDNGAAAATRRAIVRAAAEIGRSMK